MNGKYPWPADAGCFEDESDNEVFAESALDSQVAGSHYKDFVIQPVEFIHKNGLGFLEGCVVKRICRWRKKDGIQDLRKIIHEVELLIELEQGHVD